MPRSALTQLTELNRSTISDLVTELEELGLVTESEAVSSQGIGRPSLMVSPADDVVAFAISPDIDSITVGVVSFAGNVIAKVRQPTAVQPAAATVVEIASKVIDKLRSELPAKTRIAGIGVAIPGQVRSGDGVVRLAPHLNWVEVPFARMLQQTTGLPVFIDNDAGLGSVAERDFGAGKGFREIVYLFGSAGGIGGGVIHDGIPLRGSAGYAGELGHVRISDSSVEDYSGLSGTLESLIRREALVQALGLGNVDDDELREALSKDTSAKVRKVAEAQLDALAIAVGNFVNIFNH
jgi:predicted NBD/HSP70 family sugar kinase